jgi:ubiquinone/menaquinone biosynthesis C-methylase UbiE
MERESIIDYREEVKRSNSMNKDMEKWEREDGIKFLEKIGIKSGQVILDFGCRSGHYTIPSAKLVGNNTLVYALDKDRAILDELQEKAAKQSLENIILIETGNRNLEIALKDGSVDVVLLYDVLHYFKGNERKKLYQEGYRILKPNGLLSVYPKHTAKDEPLWELSELNLNDIKQEIEIIGFSFEKKYCGTISHDDGFNYGCVLNFKK